ncbi:peptidyl-tRNA hydrolase ICT1, mitochondrial [Ornithorhynchus anatinus]|uniref:peptidyl-tRNA hydrolase ICT1, mitochondrial n=1 Tax=Ornithorhynchus anatinus TaxID=9258 RepID=UPI0010A7A9DD|nr:peptidyl-tRNA hydrolase ICT1, mitochondrial [Ornithorhynchus anatinus]
MAATRCLLRSLSRGPRLRLPPPLGWGPRGRLHQDVPGSEYRSAYSLDKLYPQSGGSDAAWKVPDSAVQASTDIPLDRLTITYSRSSGPGGQNVNKVNSKAEVRFHLASADWIAEPLRQKIAIEQRNRINKLGELIVNSESSRYQLRNLAECLQKIRDIISQASQEPRAPSKETKEQHRLRVEKANRERLRQKKITATIKASRRADVD